MHTINRLDLAKKVPSVLKKIPTIRKGLPILKEMDRETALSIGSYLEDVCHNHPNKTAILYENRK